MILHEHMHYEWQFHTINLSREESLGRNDKTFSVELLLFLVSREYRTVILSQENIPRFPNAVTALFDSSGVFA